MEESVLSVCTAHIYLMNCTLKKLELFFLKFLAVAELRTWGMHYKTQPE